MWFAEYQTPGRQDWERIGGPYKTQEQAKDECRKWHKATAGGAQGTFRTVADDRRGTVYQESRPPHAWRLRWIDL